MESELRQAMGIAYALPENKNKVVDTVLMDAIVKAFKPTMECYQKLAEKLDALEAGGVYNWEWYSESLEEWYNKWQD